MKKLLFSLVAAAACGAVTAAPATATFDSATFDPKVPDSDGRYYWEIDTSTYPELTAKGEGDTALGYLQINTGSTPLWRTFSGVDNPTDVEDAELDAAGVDTNGVVVSSDVKLTACTEWPTLTDFANEKLALFLFAPEEGDTSGKTNGLYAVGGAMVDGNLTATAYRLNAEPNAITNTDGWATIAIKSYADVYVNNTGAKYPAFVISAGAKDGTVSILSVAAGEAYAPGFVEANLSNAAKTRIENRQLIPSALTSDGKLVGLGFQGEGGIDNVNLAATDFAVDAVTMTATITNATVTWTSTGTSLDGTALTFVPGAAITFTVATDLDILTVKYNDTVLTAVEGVYTIASPEANATLEVKAEPALFQVGGVGYANFAAVIAAIKAGTITGGEIDLLADASAGEDGISLEDGEYTIDLNGFTLSAEGDYAIYNVGADITIIDSSAEGTGTVDGAIGNEAGTLTINAGTYEGKIFTDDGEEGDFVGTATINGGKFAVKVEGATLVGGDWTQDGDYWTIGAATPAPSIDAEDGTIDEDEDGDYVVTPNENVTEVNITVGDYTGNVIVPSTVTKITGTIAPAQIGVQLGAYKVIGAFKLDDGVIKLDDTKSVTVKVTVDGETVSEVIPVKPELATTAADGTTEVAPFEAGAEPAATIKTIPGLTYSLDFDSDVKGDFGTSAASGTADGNRMTLRDENTNGATKRFYKIRVRK